MNNTVVQEIAARIQAIANCVERDNQEWLVRHKQTAREITEAFMPSGSGIDRGTKLDLDASNPDKLVFEFGYHHMNEAGYYDGWTEHKAIVTPSLQHGFEVKITGRDRNGIKDYLWETFHFALEAKIEWNTAKGCYYSPAVVSVIPATV